MNWRTFALDVLGLLEITAFIYVVVQMVSLKQLKRQIRRRSTTLEDLTPAQLSLIVERMRAEDELDASRFDASWFTSVHSDLLSPKGKGVSQDSGGERE